jgi:hypothetical protein
MIFRMMRNDFLLGFLTRVTMKLSEDGKLFA